MERRIYLCLAHMSGNEQKYIQEAFDTNWVVPLGPNVDAFERALEDYVGCGEHRIAALSSGTAAIHLGLVMLGVKPGDEVVCQSFTFCASANPVRYLGGVPVFVDSEPGSWNMDPDLLEKAVRERIARTGKVPKAIVPVSLYGMPYQADRIMEVASRYGIPVLEDAAEGLGSKFGGRSLGTFGSYGVLSFNGNKMITTSGGGALICPDAECRSRVLFYATQARESCTYYQHESLGFNYRMSNICAGIGRGQMTVLDAHIEHHRRLYRLYRELFEHVPGIELHGNPSEEHDSNFWLNTVTVDPSLNVTGQERAYSNAPVRTGCEPNANVEALRMGLDAAGVESRPLWKPMHLQPLYDGCEAYVNGVSESLFRTGLCLPSGPCVSEEDVRYIVSVIRSLIK
ncbi:MAG TPA: DegT/DnrJ/EryC1/StrS family aminotransferase [Candidatus Coprenecus pullistercoris]|nr:DegT/DnrJ/EryC1/StrS family aminotransferase [Candidatus Coprenecus pullistercoris]